MKKRTVIDKALCDHVRILLAGGAKLTQAAEITGVGHATISRIKAANFSAEEYERRREQQRKQEETKEDEPLPGQMKMELEPEKHDWQNVLNKLTEQNDQNKWMRFEAAQMDKIIMELDKLNDTLNMMIRVLRK